MRSDRGITITTLIIYIIGITLLIGVVSTITRYVYTNITLVNNNTQNLNEYVKFNIYFLEDIKEKNNSVYEIATNKIVFSNGNQYTFKDNAIYRNSKKICNNITDLEFSTNTDGSTGNIIVSVLFTVGEMPEFTKGTDYTIVTE